MDRELLGADERGDGRLILELADRGVDDLGAGRAEDDELIGMKAEPHAAPFCARGDGDERRGHGAVGIDGVEAIAEERVRVERQHLARDAEGADAVACAPVDGGAERGRVVVRDPAQKRAPRRRLQRAGVTRRRRAKADRLLEKRAAQAETH